MELEREHQDGVGVALTEEERPHPSSPLDEYEDKGEGEGGDFYVDDDDDEEEGLLGNNGSPGGYIIADSADNKNTSEKKNKNRDGRNRARMASYADPVTLQRELYEAAMSISNRPRYGDCFYWSAKCACVLLGAACFFLGLTTVRHHGNGTDTRPNVITPPPRSNHKSKIAVPGGQCCRQKAD
jgi:hypothetical protein